MGVQFRLPLGLRAKRAAAEDDLVGVHDRQTEARAEGAGDERLPGAAAAEHSDATHYAALTASASARGRRRETICEMPSPPIVTP